MPLQDLRKAEGTRSTENWWRGGASGKGKQSLLTATWTLSLQTVRSLGAGPWTAELPREQPGHFPSFHAPDAFWKFVSICFLQIQ